MAKGRHRISRLRRHIAVPTATAAAAGSVALAGLAFTGIAEAPGAQAASMQVWDRVALCESGDNWHINTGNGFFGGLQFSGSTWDVYHGHKYAGRADLASRAEQIEVARRVLDAQGPGAWPVCGPEAGLTRSSGHATSTALPNTAGQTSTAKHKTSAHKVRKLTNSRHVSHYRVHRGDTLSRVAARLHVHGGWRALWDANRHAVPQPNVLRVGLVLRVPA
jgi:resuscitation-promoting factor RpfA